MRLLFSVEVTLRPGVQILLPWVFIRMLSKTFSVVVKTEDSDFFCTEEAELLLFYHHNLQGSDL